MFATLVVLLASTLSCYQRHQMSVQAVVVVLEKAVSLAMHQERLRSKMEAGDVLIYAVSVRKDKG